MPLLSHGYKDLRELSVKDFFWRLYTKGFDEEDLLSSAAQVAYFFLFALFPLLLFLVSIFGIVLDSAGDLKGEMFQYLRQAMPRSAYELVQSTIEQVTESSTGGKLTFGILVALYSASAGIDSLRIALNGVYNLTEKRPWWKTKLLSLAMTLGLGVLVTVALGIVLLGSRFTTLLLSSLNLPIQSPLIISVLQTIIAIVVLVSMFAILYNYLPQHKKPSWVWITPGAIAGIILWLVLSFSFRLYLSYFNTYDKTYGSLGAVIILMLWLYLTALVILIGGSINAVLQEFTDPKAAEAGAVKAVAKEMIANPETAETKSVADKKAEILPSVAQKEKDNSAVEEDSAAEAKPAVISSETTQKTGTTKKSPLKLAVGLVVGLVENIFSSNKKR
ncbi:MAG: YihY/virulence factor BrkB family protein [Acidobacteriota bacterium]|nr:YihY/virulence factor BrkB family protein [Acidobacteriota bacterium]